MATVTPRGATRGLGEILKDLGGIAPGRVRLKSPLGFANEEDLIEFNARKKTICELVDGLLVEKAMGFNESDLALVLAGYLRAFIIPRNLGLVTGADGMMRLVVGSVRVPDLSFTSWDRIPGRRRPKGAIAGFAPDLAIEVLSRSNTKAEMARKRREYFGAGVRLVWEVNSKARTVTIFEGPACLTLLGESDTLEGGDVLPGFVLPLAHLFGELDRQGI
jgi:Uma2 family endonuclease